MSNSLLKKVTAAVALTAIVSSTIGSVSATYASTAELEAAAKLADAGVITTASDYRLGDTITRREMLKVMMNLSDSTVENKCEGKFTDLPATDWGCKYAEAALAAGYIAANSKFRPNDNVSKAESLKMVMKAKGIDKDSTEGLSWEAAYVKAAVAAGLVDMAFTDYTTASKRGFTIVTASNAMDSEEDDLGLDDLLDGTGDTVDTSTGTTDTTDTTDTVVKAGDLSVDLNPTSATTGTQVPAVGTVRFAKVDFSAGSSDVSVNTVEVKSLGLASVPTDTRIWFEINGKRISGKAAFSSDRTATISFAPALVVKAGSTETLDLYVELNSVTGNDFQFSGSVVNSSALNANGVFTTAALRTATYTVVTTEFKKQGSSTTYNQSENSVELARFTVENKKPAGVTETRDVTFNNITLRQLGTADLVDVTDLYVERNGVKVSTESIVSSKDVTFILNDKIKDASTATYYVRAKVLNVQNIAGDTYEFSLRNASDLNATEDLNGFRATNSRIDTNLNIYTIQGADVVFSRDSSVELSKNYAKGTSNVILMKGTVTSKSAITLEDITLDYTIDALNTGANALFDTVYLKVGSSVMTWSATANGAALFSGLANVNGTTPVELYAKLKDNAPSKTIKFQDLRLSSVTTAEYVSNQNPVNNYVGSISAVTVSVDSTTVSVTRVDGLGNTNLAVGSKAVTLYGLNLAVTQGNPVSISNAEFTVTNTATSGGTVGVAEVSTVTVAGVVNANSNITTTVNGTPYVTAVLASDTAVDVASRIVASIGATASNVGGTSAVVTITAAATGAQTDITCTTTDTVQTVTAAVTTQGVTYVAPTLSNQHLNNVFATLYIDGVAAKTETINAGTVKFSGISKIVTTAATRLEIKADLSDAFANGNLTLQLTNLDMVDTGTSQTVVLGSTPTSATFTIANAGGLLSSSDSNPKKSVLLSGSKDQKLLAFKVKAQNDTVKLRDLVFTTAGGLNKLSNFRVVNDSNVTIATATSTSDTGLTFANITTDDSIAMDITKNYYLIADINTNVTVSTINAITLVGGSSKIKATNGTIVTMAGNVVSNAHFIDENTLFVAKKVNNNKALSNAMVISITATGKDSITIDGYTATATQAVGYDAAGTVKMYRDNVEVSALNNNNTIDAGSTVEFVLKVEGYTLNAAFTGTRSLQVNLSDIATSNIASVNDYDNTGLTTEFIETIN